MGEFKLLTDENNIVPVARVSEKSGGGRDDGAKERLARIQSQPERVAEAERLEKLRISRGLKDPA